MQSQSAARVDELRNASSFRKWRHALKIPSWPKLLVPAVFGQGLGASFEGRFSALAAGFGLIFTLCLLVYIVLVNDLADQRVDAVKRARFPDACSPKTIVDEILPARQLLWAGAVAAVVGIALAFGSAARLGRPWAGALGVACFVLLAMYSLPPIRLNYRGGGELLEMLGVGLLLPSFNIYLQSPGAVPFYLAALWGSMLLALSSALASGLSDEESDREGGKATVATRYGNATTRSLAELSAFGGLAAWVFGGWLGIELMWLPGVLVALIGGWHWVHLRRLSADALSNRFAEQARYKTRLHRLNWESALLFTLGVVIQRLV